MSAESSLAELFAEAPPECATCAWIEDLPAGERDLFVEYLARSTVDSRRYSRTRLHEKLVEMGYPLKYTAFKECVRRHHVHQ